MKTAISLDDEILKSADDAAKQMGVSRSRIFSMAMQEFLRRRRHLSVVEQLNEVYRDAQPATDSQVLAGIKRKVRNTLKDRW
jgi:metal-responsive CopG/Arc/MetJ family transcriptional regulator